MRRSALVLAACSAASPLAGQDLSQVEIRTVPVAEGVYMLMGSGGNIGVSVGEDGVVVIDDQYAPLTERILAVIRAITPRPVRFVLNTHWHGDHTGGNENLGRAGALIVAHDNVRHRLSVEQVLDRFGQVDTIAPSPQEALPVVTFAEDVTLHLNGDELHVFHIPNAHTDGDAVVHFRRANVVHMGDTYFSNGYPFIDRASGGGIDGMVAAAGAALSLMDAGSKVIPGHGELSDREGLRSYRDVLKSVRDRVAAAKAEGRSLAEVLAMKPSAEWDAAWGGGFISPEAFVTAVYGTVGPP